MGCLTASMNNCWPLRHSFRRCAKNWQDIRCRSHCITSTCITGISYATERHIPSLMQGNTAWLILSARCLLCCVSPDIFWNMTSRHLSALPRHTLHHGCAMNQRRNEKKTIKDRNGAQWSHSCPLLSGGIVLYSIQLQFDRCEY